MIWRGYPKSISVLRDYGIDRILIHNGVSYFFNACDEEIISPNCDGVYLKWFNTIGGYDYWLFNSEHDELIKSRILGSIQSVMTDIQLNQSRRNSLGIDADDIMNLTASIDSSYSDTLRGLFLSREVYLYRGVRGSGENKWLKVTIASGSNKFIVKEGKTVKVEVSVNLPKPYTQRL